MITAISGKTNLPDAVDWNDRYLHMGDFVLSLGFGYCGLLTMDLSKTPHILIGGSTGSGKTILLKNILLQSTSKGALVYIADFKGGVDFPQWHQFSYFITSKQDFSQLLDNMVLELSHRKQRFCTVGVANIGEYNLYHPPLQRWVVACDEIAELLDKSGLNKADRELVCEIEGKLATIARQGRAFGLHLVLATQRPDASILAGQIRNNMDIRICGRADNILSQMILDTTDASTLIPKDAQGRFLTNEGTLFQGFWDNRNHFKEEMNHESSKNQRLPRYIDH